MSENFILQTFSSAYPTEDVGVNSPHHGHVDASRSDDTVSQVLQRSIKEQIRDRAYELYVQRGCRDGHQLEDWLDAEFEMFANR